MSGHRSRHRMLLVTVRPGCLIGSDGSSGGETSVTDYFARKTRQPLTTKFLPIVARETQ